MFRAPLRIKLQPIFYSLLGLTAAVAVALTAYIAVGYREFRSSDWRHRWAVAPDIARCLTNIELNHTEMALYLARLAIQDKRMSNLWWHLNYGREYLLVRWTLDNRTIVNAFMASVKTPYGTGIDAASIAHTGKTFCQTSNSSRTDLIRMIRIGYWPIKNK